MFTLVMRGRLLLCALMLAVTLLVAHAGDAVALKLPALLSNGMVLQRDRKVTFWGWATPGAAVTVTLRGKHAVGVADAEGKWRLQLGPFKAGGPYEVTVVSGAQQIVLHDVLVGEVWVCSGQSNMDYTLEGLTGGSKDAVANALAASIRNEIATANDPLLRQFALPHTASWDKAAEDCVGQWTPFTPQHARNFTATGYYFARELRQKLGVPVALVKCAWGGMPIEPYTRQEVLNREPKTRGLVEHWEKQAADYDLHAEARYQQELTTWKELEAQAKAENKPVPPMPKKAADPRQHIFWPGTVYNGMIASLTAYTIRGALWYQGEGNANPYGLSDIYGTTLRNMITDWRAQWGQGNFPFLFVQLSNLGGALDTPAEDFWAEVRDGQRQKLALKNTGMAVTVDIGQSDDIHPKNKMDVGTRLALWALAKTYGKKVEAYTGPLYKSSRVDGNRMLVRFDQAVGGLMVGHKMGVEPTAAVAEELKLFQVAGADQKWVWAQAKIVGKDTVAVWNDAVPNPVAVRYAWMMGPSGCNLYNGAGLPASPFRTDDWPFVHPAVKW